MKNAVNTLVILYVNPDKAKPSVRGERKAAGLFKQKMADLPKDEPLVARFFLVEMRFPQ